MNLRDKLRALDNKPSASVVSSTVPVFTDCSHQMTVRPLDEFPDAFSLCRETLMLMQREPVPELFDPRRILYMDTETTGLTGSGSVAFLVGLGWLTDHGFEIHQFLIRDYPEEPFLLQHLQAGFKRFDLLCTFNGKSFDIPLLKTRFLMNRMDPEALDLPHLDLLHLSRRLWKLRLAKCNLGNLEELILGKPRTDDLPGNEVPDRYFRYLKTGQISLLDDVLRHNAQDIASLCILLSHMASLYMHPENIRYDEDLFSMGRFLEKDHHLPEAQRCYRLSAGRLRVKAGMALASTYRRTGKQEEASKLWHQMIRNGQGGITPYIELAKYLEHVQKDIPAAMEITRQALVRISEPSLRQLRSVQEAKNELQYRYERLKRKFNQKEQHHGISDKSESTEGTDCPG